MNNRSTSNLGLISLPNLQVVVLFWPQITMMTYINGQVHTSLSTKIIFNPTLDLQNSRATNNRKRTWEMNAFYNILH